MKVKLQLFPFSDVDVFKRIISKDWTGGSCVLRSMKREIKGYDEYEIVLILEKNIRAFLGLHKLTHGLTFGIIYFCKYYRQ